jgi:hypothetical protein
MEIELLVKGELGDVNIEDVKVKDVDDAEELKTLMTLKTLKDDERMRLLEIDEDLEGELL